MLLISFVKYQNASFTTDLMMYVELIGRGLQPAVHAIDEDTTEWNKSKNGLHVCGGLIQIESWNCVSFSHALQASWLLP
jgi:hypothetical protein